MSDLRAQLEQTIAALEAQRPALGDEVVARALGPLRAKLDELVNGPDDQQLRQVTVLFADIVGSTTLSERLDPEDINAVMDGALQRLTDIVAAHQGKVLQYAGDSLLAVFGASVAHEDDPERAVHAGLAILAEGRAQGLLVQQRHGHSGFNLRVGIHTGGVLLGGGVDGEHTIRGLAVSLAARMEQTAPPGMLRISHDTYRHVRGLFTVLPQPLLQVKGHADPLQTYLVVAAVAGPARQAQRGVEGVQAPMIGREPELALLQQAWQASGPGGAHALAAVTVVAEAGMGKSRLVTEFHRWIDAQGPPVLWLEAHASERARGRPYGLMRDLFDAVAQIRGSDPPAVARDKWLDAVAPILRGDGDAAVLGHLLGMDFSADPAVRALQGEARQLRDRAFFHATELLRRVGEDAGAMLLMFEDLQWADDGTLDFIDHLLRTHTGRRPMLVGVTRPALYERRPGWGEAWQRHRRADLPALGTEESGRLADTLLRKLQQVPLSLRELLTEHADGNPFCLEELVNMLIDQGAIVAAADRWTLVPERLHGLAVPTTLTGVLQARLDALPPAELRTLLLAAVVGHVFWDDALLALELPVAATLPTLLARELVVEHAASSLEGRREFSFRHHTLHQVSYARVLKRQRQPAHATVARWLAAQPGPAHLDQIAEHFERGGETDQAANYWQRAADAAWGRFALSPALQHVERALALVAPEAVERRWELTYLQVRALADLNLQARSSPALDELDRLSSALGDPARRARALERRARLHLDSGDTARALDCAQQAARLAEGVDAQCAVLAQVQTLLALGRLGRHAEARAEAPVMLARARAAGLPRTEALILNQMGNHAIDEGDFETAIEHLERALAMHRQAGDRVNEGGTLANLGFAAMTLGDYPVAQQLFMQALSLCAAIGHRNNEGIVRINLALVLLNLGDAQAARTQANQSLELLLASGDRWGEAAALRVAGQAAEALGDSAAATPLLCASRDLFDELALPHLAIEAMAALAAGALARGELDIARREVRAILDRQAGGAGLEGTDEPLRIQLTCWQVLATIGDERAPAVLESAWQALDSRARRIANAARRRTFIDAVPFHRAIADAWRAALAVNPPLDWQRSSAARWAAAAPADGPSEEGPSAS